MPRITDAELAEIAPLFPTLLKAMLKSGPQVPPILKKSALGERHMRVLILLSSGPQSVSELSAQLRVTLSTTSLLVGELSRAGFVERTEDPNDRRRTIVDLASEHRQEIGGFVARRAGYIRSALEQLDPEERASFAKGMRAAVTALEAAAEPSDSLEEDWLKRPPAW